MTIFLFVDYIYQVDLHLYNPHYHFTIIFLHSNSDNEILLTLLVFDKISDSNTFNEFNYSISMEITILFLIHIH